MTIVLLIITVLSLALAVRMAHRNNQLKKIPVPFEAIQLDIAGGDVIRLSQAISIPNHITDDDNLRAICIEKGILSLLKEVRKHIRVIEYEPYFGEDRYRLHLWLADQSRVPMSFYNSPVDKAFIINDITPSPNG